VGRVARVADGHPGWDDAEMSYESLDVAKDYTDLPLPPKTAGDLAKAQNMLVESLRSAIDELDTFARLLEQQAKSRDE
jgi:hypothetical protein